MKEACEIQRSLPFKALASDLMRAYESPWDLYWLLLKHEGMRVRVVCRSTDGVRVAKKKRLKNPLQTSLKTKEKHAGQKEKKAE